MGAAARDPRQTHFIGIVSTQSLKKQRRNLKVQSLLGLTLAPSPSLEVRRLPVPGGPRARGGGGPG
jgi:hypothetical protein